MNSHTKLIQQVTFGSAPGFQTLLTISESDVPKGIYELKFETTFAAAKDPEAKLTRAQLFVSKAELTRIGNAIHSLLTSQRS